MHRNALAPAIAIMLVAALVALGRSCGQPQFDMAQALADIQADAGIWDNQWKKHAQKAGALRIRLRTERDPLERIELRRQIAEHHLLGGAVEAAVSGFRSLISDTQDSVPPRYSQLLRSQLALAHLRQGETANCVWNHSADSCLFPLAGDGIHARQLGARQAIEQLQGLLDDPQLDPARAPGYRWLLNIAYMALGEYPDGVPPAQLIDPSQFESEESIARFRDVATGQGVEVFGLSGGAIMDDFNGDGHLDLLMSSWDIGHDVQLRLGSARDGFQKPAPPTGLEGLGGGLNLVHADYDNDGDRDVFVLRGAWLHDRGKHPNSLLRNDGHGHFKDVTAQAGLLSHYPTQTAAWVDVDNNGCLDLVIGNELLRAAVPWPDTAKNIELYVSNCQGEFAEMAASAGLAADGMIKGVVAGDYDNDGWQDIYVSILGAGNRLFRNAGTGPNGLPHFAETGEQAGVREPLKSFPTWFWDYNNDGWLDLFVGGYSAGLDEVAREAMGESGVPGARPRLYRNQGGQFKDVTVAAGLDCLLLPMGSNYGDLDNDGFEDFYLGTGTPRLEMLLPNRMFRNADGQRFLDVTTAGGFGHLQKGHGVAFGDKDGDGDQDILAVVGGAHSSDGFWNSLYENPGFHASWVTLQLEGRRANRDAIGARIAVRTRQPDGTTRTLHRVVSSGGSFGGNSLQQEIGLGEAESILSIDVQWPGFESQRFLGPIAPNRSYRLVEGEAGLRPAS